MNSLSNKKEIFSELRRYLFFSVDKGTNNELKLSTLKSKDEIVNEFKTLKTIEIDNLGSFESYVNYDHYLIFKFNDEYYFCDTELVPGLKEKSMIKITDYNQLLRKDKIKKIDENTTN
jgi:hypothetical protein